MRSLLLALTLAALAPLQTYAADPGGTCIGAQVGEHQSYDCLNESLARAAVRAHAPVVTGTLSATSPAPAVGSFNQTAVQERMGSNFGKSVLPQRPPVPVFLSPIPPR